MSKGRMFYKNNKAIVWAAIVSILLVAGILFQVKDEVTRFTLIMPVFAGFILFSILITSDEDLEDAETPDKKDVHTSEEKSEKHHKTAKSKKLGKK